jgi:glycosyltransferase involved in cell wall biosynthesis
MTRIAVLVPCFNEAATIAQVVRDFRAQLPEAEVHVFDNNSTDGSAELARAEGARVQLVPRRGKGEVVRAMFRDVDAEVYVMVDGDSTYPAERVRELVAPVMDGRAEMVVGTRLAQFEDDSFRRMHVFGNRLVLRTINASFGSELRDVMSGYRAFSRRFVKTMPVLSQGFEIETEMTLHALEHRMPIREVPVPYGARPEGSSSKLRTFHDGARVLRTIGSLYKHYHPMRFFGGLGLLLLLMGLVAGVLVTVEFIQYGQVVGVARAVFSVACGILGVIALATGFILDTVNRRARELYVLLADQVVDRGRGPRP